MQKTKTFFLTLLLSFFIIWLSVEGWALKVFFTNPISSIKEQQIVQIPKGSSTQKVINILLEKQLIRDPTWFKWLLKYQGKTDKIKAGEIKINPKWTVNQLIDALVKGKEVSYSVTIIAGDTFKQAFKKLVIIENIKQDVSLNELTILKEVFDIDTSLEGMLLPETYFYNSGETIKKLLLRSYIDLNNLLAEQWQNREKNLPLKSAYEALILASIVEKETAKASERPLIAGVFINRLKKRMRLQTDPTVIYGMGKNYAGDIRSKDLITYTPYNTYKIKGLPPTPIALASAESIKAVMHPEVSNYLYFVAKGTGDGGHTFSKTLAEHNKAVQEYLKIRRNYE